MLALADKRGSAAVAATLYEETPESIRRRDELALERRQSRPLGADLGARPTKRDRRRLDALRRAQRRRRDMPLSRRTRPRRTRATGYRKRSDCGSMELPGEPVEVQLVERASRRRRLCGSRSAGSGMIVSRERRRTDGLEARARLDPVTDVDRAKAFYAEQAGFVADHDHVISDELRFVQLTPPGSACSITLGVGITDAPPGSAQVQLVVDDVEAAARELAGPRRRGRRGSGVPVGLVRLLRRPRRERLGGAAAAGLTGELAYARAPVVPVQTATQAPAGCCGAAGGFACGFAFGSARSGAEKNSRALRVFVCCSPLRSTPLVLRNDLVSAATWNASDEAHFVESSRIRAPSGYNQSSATSLRPRSGRREPQLQDEDRPQDGQLVEPEAIRCVLGVERALFLREELAQRSPSAIASRRRSARLHRRRADDPPAWRPSSTPKRPTISAPTPSSGRKTSASSRRSRWPSSAHAEPDDDAVPLRPGRACRRRTRRIWAPADRARALSTRARRWAWDAQLQLDAIGRPRRARDARRPSERSRCSCSVDDSLVGDGRSHPIGQQAAGPCTDRLTRRSVPPRAGRRITWVVAACANDLPAITGTTKRPALQAFQQWGRVLTGLAVRSSRLSRRGNGRDRRPVTAGRSNNWSPYSSVSHVPCFSRTAGSAC